jgi:hypothetical protein
MLAEPPVPDTGYGDWNEYLHACNGIPATHCVASTLTLFAQFLAPVGFKVHGCRVSREYTSSAASIT